MLRLTGEYECRLDGKGRLKLPAALLRQLGGMSAQTFVLNRGFEKCLTLNPKEIWEKRTREFSNLNIYNPRHREFIRYFYRGASEVTTDTAERVLIPKSLMEYAGLDKDVIVLAYQEQIELWAKDRYEARLAEEPADFSELANEVAGHLRPFPEDKSQYPG